MTVILGTLAHATAVTILAPSLAIPPASYSLPTMKPTAETREGAEQVKPGWILDGSGGLLERFRSSLPVSWAEAVKKMSMVPTDLLCFGGK